MRGLVILATLASLGCTRSGLHDDINCGDGERVTVRNNAFCVFPGEGIFPCPDELPFVVIYADTGFCAIEPAPPTPLLSLAIDVVNEVEHDAVLRDAMMTRDAEFEE